MSCRGAGIRNIDVAHNVLYGEGCPRPSNVFYAFVCRALLGHAVRTQDGANDLDAEGKTPIFAPGSHRRELAAIPAAAGLPAGTRYHSILVETGGKATQARQNGWPPPQASAGPQWPGSASPDACLRTTVVPLRR